MAIRVVSIISRMNVGGPAVLLKELIDNLPENEFEHILITGRCLSNEIDYLEEHPIKSRVIYIDSLKRSILPTRDLISFFKLIVLLKQLRPDIVHTHTSKAGVLGRIAAKIASRDARIIHTFHGHILYGYFNKLLTFVYRAVEVALGKITDDAVAITTPVMTELQQARIALRARWHVIHPGVKDTSGELDRSYIDKNCFKLIWVGRFAEVKNPKLAVRAIEKLSGEGIENINLTMVGDGDLLPECQQIVEDANLKVNFLGWRTDVRALFADADLLLLTSINEGLGLVVLEAALEKTPSITTKVGGVSDFLVDGVTGFNANLNADSFASQIHRLSRDPETLARVGIAARQKALLDFSVSGYIRGHVELYRSRW